MTEHTEFISWVSVVVTARFHNPSILNPDFLRIHDIVPKDLESTEVLTTQAVSTVRFQNNVSFFVSEERLEVKQDIGGNFPTECPIYDMAIKYVEKLPHVNYQAVGLNWALLLLREKPTEWMVRRFFRQGSWLKGKHKPVRCAISLSYEADGATCSVGMAPGSMKKGEEPRAEALETNWNFHHQGPFSLEQIKGLIAGWSKHEAFLKASTSRLLLGQLR